MAKKKTPNTPKKQTQIKLLATYISNKGLTP